MPEQLTVLARDLHVGDRFVGKGDRVWVVLSVSIGRQGGEVSQRLVTEVEGKPFVSTVTPPPDARVVVLNRDDRITLQQAVSNLRAAGLDPIPLEDDT